jgi:hypothetical protein
MWIQKCTWLDVRGDCSFCWCWWNYHHCFNFLSYNLYQLYINYYEFAKRKSNICKNNSKKQTRLCLFKADLDQRYLRGFAIKNLPWLCFYFKSIYIHVQSSFRSEIFVKDCLQEYMFDMQILQGKCVRRNKTALGLRDRLRLLSKLRIWGPIKPLVNAQPEFRTLSEFYIIIFLNKLKIVENKLKKIFKKSKKRLRLKLWDPSDVPAEPPLIGPVDMLLLTIGISLGSSISVLL